MKEIEEKGIKKYISEDNMVFLVKQVCQLHERKYYYEKFIYKFDICDVELGVFSCEKSFRITEYNKKELPFLLSLMIEFDIKNDLIVPRIFGNKIDFEPFRPKNIMDTLKIDEDIPNGIYVMGVTNKPSENILKVDILSKGDIKTMILDKADEYEQIFGEPIGWY